MYMQFIFKVTLLTTNFPIKTNVQYRIESAVLRRPYAFHSPPKSVIMLLVAQISAQQQPTTIGLSIGEETKLTRKVSLLYARLCDRTVATHYKQLDLIYVLVIAIVIISARDILRYQLWTYGQSQDDGRCIYLKVKQVTQEKFTICNCFGENKKCQPNVSINCICKNS